MTHIVCASSRIRWPFYALALVVAVSIFCGGTRTPLAQSLITNCGVVADSPSASLNPVIVGQQTVVSLGASPAQNSPSVNEECVISSVQWDWVYSSNVQYRATQSDSWGAPPASPSFDFSQPDKSSPTAQLKITFPAAGYWSLSMQVTGTWIGGPANPACTSCPTCGSCQGTDTKALNVTVVDLQSVTATYDKIAAGGIGNSAHQTAVVAKVVPPTAGQTINFSITGGGDGIDCSGACGSAGDPCSSACLSSAVNAKLSAATATTNSNGIAQVTLTSSNLAGAVCSVQGSLGTRTGSTSVTFLKPQMESLTYSNPVGPKQTFPVRTRLTIARGTSSIPVPGHTVVNTMQSLHLQNPDPTSGKMEINLATTDPADWMCANKCELSQKLQTFAKVSDGASATSDSDGVVRFKVQLLDENLQLKDVGFQCCAITALSSCTLLDGGVAQSGTATLKEPKIDLVSVECTSDWDAFYDGIIFGEANYDKPKAWDRGEQFVQYCWTAMPQSSHPICHKMNKQVSFELNLQVTTDSDLTVVVTGASSGQDSLTFPAQTVTLSNGSNSVDVTSGGTSMLKSLGRLNHGFTWTFKTLSGDVLATIAQPDIDIYTTIDDPKGSGEPYYVTPGRLNVAYSEWYGAGCDISDCVLLTIKKLMASYTQNFWVQRSLINNKPPEFVWNFSYVATESGAMDVDGRPTTGCDCLSTVTHLKAVLSILGAETGTMAEARYIAKYNTVDDKMRALKAIVGSFRGGNGMPAITADLFGKPLRNDVPETNAWAVVFVDSNNDPNAFESVATISVGGTTYYFPGGTSRMYTDENDVITVMAKLIWINNNMPSGKDDQIYSTANSVAVNCP